MTIDERLEAIAMNLELLSHSVEDGRREYEAWRREHEAWRREHQELVSQQVARSGHDTADLRENVNSLARSVAQMVIVAQAHDRRIARLEHHATT